MFLRKADHLLLNWLLLWLILTYHTNILMRSAAHRLHVWPARPRGMTHLRPRERLVTECSSTFASLGCQLRATEGGVVPPTRTPTRSSRFLSVHNKLSFWKVDTHIHTHTAGLVILSCMDSPEKPDETWRLLLRNARGEDGEESRKRTGGDLWSDFLWLLFFAVIFWKETKGRRGETMAQSSFPTAG